uniref:Uncharacterized protein n=1 Tax=Rhizophora mucronata TaxID=61149 RepID=A0A2P2M6L3_RHIMU
MQLVAKYPLADWECAMPELLRARFRIKFRQIECISSYKEINKKKKEA